MSLSPFFHGFARGAAVGFVFMACFLLLFRLLTGHWIGG